MFFSFIMFFSCFLSFRSISTDMSQIIVFSVEVPVVQIVEVIHVMLIHLRGSGFAKVFRIPCIVFRSPGGSPGTSERSRASCSAVRYVLE